MINVVFLLLVFFVAAGTVRAPDPIEASPPASERIGDAPVARRTLHLGADGALALDGRTLGATPLAVALTPLAGAGGSPAPVEPLALRADASASFALLRATVDALRAAGVTEVELITTRASAETP